MIPKNTVKNKVYNHWKDEDFKIKIRINCETCNFESNEIHYDIVMSPTNLKPFPTPQDRQRAVRDYLIISL